MYVRHLATLLVAVISIASPVNVLAEDRFIECMSWNYKYKECGFRNKKIYAVDLNEQFSKADCRKGYSYGLTGKGTIYVSHGCRATFLVSAGVAPKPPPPSYSYYIVGRYYCFYSNGRDAGDCTVTTHGQSCQGALSAQRREIARVPDICAYCSNVTDPSKHFRGQVEYIQGGPCQNYP